MATNEPDPLADKLLTIITEAVMRAVANTGGFTVHDAAQHRSFLRALGGSMGLFALSAEPSGSLTHEDAKAAVLNGFDSKFRPDALARLGKSS